jgi:hypothetical protein
MSDFHSESRVLDLDTIDRNNWRARISQLKRELKSGEERPLMAPSIAPRRFPRRRSHQAALDHPVDHSRPRTYESSRPARAMVPSVESDHSHP